MAEHKDLKDTDFDPQQIAAMVHVGSMMGDPTDNEFDQEVARHMRENDEHEANFKKMRSAARSENVDIGPGEFENQQTQQRQALGQQQALQGAAQAQQAQKAQVPLSPGVEAPGPQGETEPYPAQRGQAQK